MNLSSYIINNNTVDSSNIITDYITDNSENIIGSGTKKYNKLLTNTNESECINGCSSCVSTETKKLMESFLAKKTKNCAKKIKDDDVVDKVKNVLKCNNESCVLTHKEFVKFANNECNGQNPLSYDLSVYFKTSGPRNDTTLLNNYNIDNTLILWAREFKNFYPCSFSMIDFKTVTNEFGSIDLAQLINENNIFYEDPIYGKQYGPFKTFGCVLNTDVSTGKGKHWVCVFVDCRPTNTWTVEYFNSSGNPPHKDVTEWMETQKNNLLKLNNSVKTIVVTNIVHQKGNTECGMYVLYYIRSRLDGISYSHFKNNRIDDNEVTEFRKHVFRYH